MYEDLLPQYLIKKSNPSEKTILGSEVKIIYGKDVEAVIKCYVAAVDRDAGITLHRFSDDEEIFCLNRKDFIRAANYQGIPNAVEKYNAVFDYCFSCFANGEYPGGTKTLSEISGGVLSLPGTGYQMKCAFK